MCVICKQRNLTKILLIGYLRYYYNFKKLYFCLHTQKLYKISMFEDNLEIYKNSVFEYMVRVSGITSLKTLWQQI